MALSPKIVLQPAALPVTPIITKRVTAKAVRSIRLRIAAAVIPHVQKPPMVQPSVQQMERAAMTAIVPVIRHFVQMPV